MAKRKAVAGSGITEREVTLYSGEDMQPAVEAWLARHDRALSEGGGQFGAAVLNVERNCRRIVAKAPAGPPFEPDSDEAHAARILAGIRAARASIERGDADSAARHAVHVGRLVTEARIEHLWGDDMQRGRKIASTMKATARRANQARSLDAKHRYQEWQAAADALWTVNKHLSATRVSRIIAGDGGNPDTIRRNITRR